MGEPQVEPTGKPFPGYDFDTFDGCVTAFANEPSIDDPEAFCAWLEEEGAEALSDPNAEEVLAGLEVEFVSAVDRPAQDSEWLIAKNAEDPDGDRHRWQSEVTLYVRKDDQADDDGEREAKQIAFAPVLVPKEADKDGDVIPKPAIEDAAHKYLAEYRKVDSDHDLRDGKGTPVESWTLKQDTSFERPDGTESRTYPKGTWVMGIKFDDETWGRVLDGELSGLSIYGGAKPIDVDALLQGAKGTGTQTKDADGSPEDAPDPKGSGGEDGVEAVGKHESMGTEDDPGDNAGNGDGESVSKQLDAAQVSEMLATVGEKSGISGDSSIKDFVMALVEDGDVDEAEVRNMAVLLNGGSGGGDGGEGESDGMGGDEGGEDDEGIDLDADGKSEGDADGGDDVDKDTDADGDGDGDDVEKSVGDDRIDRIESAVESLADTVDDLQKQVEDEPWADKMSGDQDLSDRIAKDLTGADDADVARKAIREQVAKNDDDGGPNVDYEGITEDEDVTAEASDPDDGGSDGSLHSKAANTRMTGGD